MPQSPTRQPRPAITPRTPAKKEPQPEIIEEILELAGEIQAHLRRSCFGALRVGLRLLALHRQTGESDEAASFRGAIRALEGLDVHASTAYRWINAASAVLCRAHDTEHIADVLLPPPGHREWDKLEGVLKQASEGMSLRRLLVGAPATGDESRLDHLITSAEAGCPHAEEMLDKVARGEMTLVQAIRAAAGAAATRDKTRHDPVYLDIDGRTGQPTGLFPKCLVTLSNTFARWESLDETARQAARQSWKALVSQLPRELR